MKLTAFFEQFSKFLKFLFFHFYNIICNLRDAQDGIPLNKLVSDFVAIILRAGVMLLLISIAFVSFVFLPQGKDVMLIVSEDLSVGKVGSLLWLIFGTTIWAVFSEFGVRYTIYVTDNSGKSLTEERVIWRRALQEAIGDLFLMLPFLIIILGLVFNRPLDHLFDTDIKANNYREMIVFWLPILLVYLVFNAIARVYYVKRVKSNGNLSYKDLKAYFIKNWWWISIVKKHLKLPGRENIWCNKKLTGIYNDYVFSIAKGSNFKDEARTKMHEFISIFMNKNADKRNEFPQSSYLPNHKRVPKLFELRRFSEDSDKVLPVAFSSFMYDENRCKLIEIKENIDGNYRWTYHIPNKFYKKLHQHVHTILFLSILFFIIILLLDVNSYQNVGAPGLMVLAFACWTGIYIGIIYLDYAIFRRGKPLFIGEPYRTNIRFYREPKYKAIDLIRGRFSIRLLLIALLIVSSWRNNDHPVRFNEAGHVDNRPTLQAHFMHWMNHYITDTVNNKYYSKKDSSYVYPVVFVCAEGGALRTGAYSSMMLSALQDNMLRDSATVKYIRSIKNDSFRNKIKSYDFRKSIYAMSGVSGGGLGLAFFNTIAFFDRNRNFSEHGYKNKCKQFFTNDFLAPVLGKMLYGDMLNYFIPFHVSAFDRAIALEQIWECSYKHTGQNNYFAEDYLNNYNYLNATKGDSSYPALFLNTTEVETGMQCWIANVRPEKMPFAENRDLLNKKIQGGINYSTAVNFSTRFPLLSPAANVRQCSDKKLHYLDGGYVENTGLATMIEAIQELDTCFKHFEKYKRCKIKPYLISFLFSKDTVVNNTANIDFGNEYTEILYGIYNTRVGRSNLAKWNAIREIGKLNGRVIFLPLDENGKQVPMNWVLSEQSMQNLDSFVVKMWNNCSKNNLSQLYCFDADLVHSFDTSVIHLKPKKSLKKGH